MPFQYCVAEAHVESLTVVKNKIADVMEACLHFEEKTKKRRKVLSEAIDNSNAKRYGDKTQDWWLHDYEKVMAANRKKD